jgi:hypothetical protein
MVHTGLSKERTGDFSLISAQFSCTVLARVSTKTIVPL